MKNNPKLAPSSYDFNINNPVKYFAQWDRKWGYESYGGECIGTYGCGPTSIAMVLQGFVIDVSPKDIGRYAKEIL